MKIITLTAIVFAITLALVACGSDEPVAGENDAPAATTERAPTVGKEIADDLNNSMDRAREVNQMMMDEKENIDAALKEAEGGVDPG